MQSFGIKRRILAENLDILVCRGEKFQSEWRYDSNFSFHLCLLNGRSSLAKKVRSLQADCPNNLICKWWAVWWWNFYGKAISFLLKCFPRARRGKVGKNVDEEREEVEEKNKYGCRMRVRKLWKENVCVVGWGRREKAKRKSLRLRNIFFVDLAKFHACVYAWDSTDELCFWCRKRENNGVKEFSHLPENNRNGLNNEKINVIFQFFWVSNCETITRDSACERFKAERAEKCFVSFRAVTLGTCMQSREVDFPCFAPALVSLTFASSLLFHPFQPLCPPVSDETKTKNKTHNSWLRSLRTDCCALETFRLSEFLYDNQINADEI